MGQNKTVPQSIMKMPILMTWKQSWKHQKRELKANNVDCWLANQAEYRDKHEFVVNVSESFHFCYRYLNLFSIVTHSPHTLSHTFTFSFTFCHTLPHTLTHSHALYYFADLTGQQEDETMMAAQDCAWNLFGDETILESIVLELAVIVDAEKMVADGRCLWWRVVIRHGGQSCVVGSFWERRCYWYHCRWCYVDDFVY